jgi:hypothetical protein
MAAALLCFGRSPYEKVAIVSKTWPVEVDESAYRA